MKFTLASLQIFIFAAILQLAAGRPISITRGNGTAIGYDGGGFPHLTPIISRGGGTAIGWSIVGSPGSIVRGDGTATGYSGVGSHLPQEGSVDNYYDILCDPTTLCPAKKMVVAPCGYHTWLWESAHPERPKNRGGVESCVAS
ncbi:hypothetical protein C8J57DRAFT_1236202 [Mycena rebaudengoi]|nr:hypothetical protein C8J57DRAFT_1255960 [Mycena rebaudengoi]KAJ7255781.1 hypothetical protein C8J57DRAFT_1236202 [Mycena rebaudengoi]